jgi:hypothetical protein
MHVSRGVIACLLQLLLIIPTHRACEDSQILLIHILTCFWTWAMALHMTKQSFDVCCRQEWVMPGLHPKCHILTPQQRRRRSVYFNAASPALADHLRNSTTLVTANEIESWVTRELQAVILEEDVKLICQVVLATINTLAATLCNTGTR